jgi:hypothetical protein
MSGISIIYPTGLDKLLYVMILQYKSNTQFRRLKNVNASAVFFFLKNVFTAFI